MNSDPRLSLAAERLRELLDYERATGLFTRRRARGGHPVDSVAGAPDSFGHIQIRVDGKLYLAHRLAWLHVHGVWPDGDLDHEDTVPDHNWLSNLRPATDSQNLANARLRRDRVGGLKGANYHSRDNIWQARIRKDGVLIYLGSFPTAEAAHAAYVAKAKQLFGEFARAS